MSLMIRARLFKKPEIILKLLGLLEPQSIPPSALLIGLILASRFRFTFIEAAEELQARFGDEVTDSEFQLACRQLIYDIERMEHESSEFGMNNPDLFQQAFGPDNHEIVNGFYEVWFPIRKELFALIKQRIEEGSSRCPR